MLNGNSHGGHADDWQVVDLLGSPASSVTMSFEQLFKLYRGPRFTDELETLSGSAAKSCNRLRSQMSGALHVVRSSSRVSATPCWLAHGVRQNFVQLDDNWCLAP